MLNSLKNKLNEIYHDNTLSSNDWRRKIVYLIKQRRTKEDFQCFMKLYRLRKIKNVSNITVVFLLQMPEVWEKQKPIYQEMKRRENIRTIILAIPEYNIKTEKHDMRHNIAYNYAQEEGLSEVIRADRDGSWISLEELCPNYVFYQRPYESYLPEIYRSKNVLNYAKTCYLPYAFFSSTMAELTMDYERSFARNIYMNFLTNKEMVGRVRKKFIWTYWLGLRKIQYLGVPLWETIKQGKEGADYNQIWAKWGWKGQKIRTLWTPRWSIDEKLGGSHFFEYRSQFEQFSEENSDFFIVFRPHPLAFANYVKEGVMSEADVAEMREKYENSESMAIDFQREYIDTFRETDVLITDVSSMMIEFFLTGKPIIFCDTNMQVDSLYRDVISVLYCASNWQEIQRILEKLASGKDPMKEEREKIIKKWFGNSERVSEKIVDMMVKDCM